MQLERQGFTTEEIIEAFHSPKRQIDFRFELVDANGVKKKDLTNILSASVEQNSLAAIKRTASFTITEDPDINYLSDRIKPYVRIFVDQQKVVNAFSAFLASTFPTIFEKQAVGRNEWVDFPLGEFLLTSPTRKDNGPNIIRDVKCYDGLLVLQEDKFAERLFFPSGMLIHESVIEILVGAGITRHNIQVSTKTLESDVEFEIGKEKLIAINELLKMGIYEEIHVDAEGYYKANEYISPVNIAADYSYKTDRKSVVFGGYEEELDYWNVPNKWVVVRTVSDRPPLTSTYTNTNQLSPTSTVSRGRTILAYEEIDNIPDQQSLDSYTERLAFEQSQVYGVVKFETAIMPFHDFMNVLDIQFDDLIGNGKYIETDWSIPLEVGGKMSHTVKRVMEI